MQTNIRRKTRHVSFGARVAAAFGLAMLLCVSSQPGTRTASAVGSSCNSINECTDQINASRAAVGSLKTEAVSYKDAITRLGSQIGSVQGEISTNQSRQTSLEQQITSAQQQIVQQKATLGEVVKTMYVDGQMTPIEMLATSSNLSDYVNKEEYRNAVQSQIQDTLAKIAQLQSQLQSQKDQVSSIISQQQSQAAQLRDAQSAQNSLLGLNQSQQADYNAQTAANQSKLAALIAAQRTANVSSKGGYYFIRFPGAVHGFSPASYPYLHSGFSMSTAPGCNDGDGPDKWGYCTRQCVSYTAYAVEASGRSAPKYWGNAKNWVARAKAAGVPVYNTPQPGDVAISTAGTWGHAMYVEQVSGNKVYVSQMNQQLTGQFSYQWRQWQ